MPFNYFYLQFFYDTNLVIEYYDLKKESSIRLLYTMLTAQTVYQCILQSLQVIYSHVHLTATS